MSIQHALLVSLLEQPSTGYQLANRFDRSIGYFWQATHQQIYRELGRMAKSGWVRADSDDGGDRRQRKVYHVLPAGRAELIRWAKEPDPSSNNGQTLLIKLRADAVIGPLDLEGQLREFVEQHQARLDVYRDIERRDFSSQAMTHAQRLQYVVLRRGIMLEESWIEWAEEVLPLLSTADSTA